MNIAGKLAFLDKAVTSIATHDDVDSVTLIAALNQAKTTIQAKIDAITASNAADAAAAIAAPVEA